SQVLARHNADDWPSGLRKGAGALRFLENAGVRHRRHPVAIRTRARFQGREVTVGNVARTVKLSEQDTDLWDQAVTRAGGRGSFYPRTNYFVRGSVARFPAQSDYQTLDSRSRLAYAKLVVTALQELVDDELIVGFSRPNH